jgi:hypothetical protein
MKKLILTAIALAGSLSAAVIDVNATTRGSFDETNASTLSASAAFLAGILNTVEYRDYFQFDVPVFTGTVTGATLLFANLPSNHAASDLGLPVTFEAAAVSGAPSFTAIGSGAAYGSTSVDTDTPPSSLSVVLNALALSTIGSGSSFQVGGRITDLVTTPVLLDQYALGFTNSGGRLSPTVTLEITTSDVTGGAVPEPSSLLLAASGAGLLFLRRRRIA